MAQRVRQCRLTIEIHTAGFKVIEATPSRLCWQMRPRSGDENSVNPESEIFRPLRPGLSHIPGAILLNASSPYRKAGGCIRLSAVQHDCGDEYHTRQGDHRGGVRGRPASAAAEYGAEFHDDIVGFVPREMVDAGTVRERVELLPAEGVRYRAFVDPSGGRQRNQ